jgi:hypothetical protein
MITKAQIQSLPPETAVEWIVGALASPLSKAQRAALVIAIRDGGRVQAGTNTHNGHEERVSASALRVLVRLGYLNHCFGSEGGMGGQLSERSMARLAASWIEYGLGHA